MDFNFVGASYTGPSIYQSDEECINWRPEVAANDPDSIYYGFLGTQQTRGVVALYPTPGLIPVITSLPAAPVRAMHTVSGGATLIVVVGNSVYAVSAGLVATSIGALATSVGPVSIDDNGLYCYFVDGPNRYSSLLNGSSFAQIASTDGAFVGGTTVSAADNYLVYSAPNSQQFAATNPLGSTVGLSNTTPALSFGAKFGAPDNLVALLFIARELYLFGEVSSEVWADIGSFPFPYAIVPGSNSQHGCAAQSSLARLGESCAWLGKDTRGQAVVVQMNGYTPTRISTHAVENDLLGQTITDAIGFTYQLEGHECYVLTFPTADRTWVFDNTTKLWHKWLWVDTKNVYHRHRANCAAVFQGMNLVGDWQNGIVYQLSNSTYTDNGNPIRRLRRAPHVVSDFQRIFFDELQIQFQPGVGLPTGQGSMPQAMLRWSDDGGSAWSNEHWCSIGQAGQYKNRAIWRRMGWARDRVYEVVVTDPIRAVIVSANLKASPGDN